MAEGDRQGPHDLRRQEPAPQLPGGRLACALIFNERQRHQHRAPDHRAGSCSTTRSSSSSRSTSPTCWPSRRSTRTGPASAAASATTWPTATCRRTASATPAKFKFPRGVILEHEPGRGAAASIRTTRSRSRSRSRTPGTSTRTARHALHPWDGETKLNYTGPKPPYEQLDENGKYRGSRRRAGRATRWKSGRWRACWSAYASGQRRGQGGRDRGAQGAQACRSRRSSPRWAAPPPAASRRGSSCAGAEEYDAAARQHQGGRPTHRRHPQLGSGDLAGRSARAWASPRRRAARSATGSTSRTGRSTTTSWSCRAPGTPRRGTRRDSAALRGSADRHAGGGPRAAGRDPAHHPLLRSVPGLRLARISVRTGAPWQR